MKFPLLILALLATASAQEKFYEFKHEGPQPDHLRPVEESQIKRLNQMTQGLKFPYASLATMMVDGSFGGCSGVCLAGTIPSEDERSSPEKMSALKYRLIFSKRPALEKEQRDGPLTTFSVEVPMNFAVPMQRLWSQLILGTEYRPAAESVMDGKSVYFASRTGEDFIRGMACAPPDDGVVDKVAKLALSLEDLRDLPDIQKTEKLKAFIVQMQVLSRQLQPLNDVDK